MMSDTPELLSLRQKKNCVSTFQIQTRETYKVAEADPQLWKKTCVSEESDSTAFTSS
jgi:hypothetical protein